MFTREGRVSFEFRRQGLVWLEDTSTSPHTYYRLHTGRDVTFSQTFKQGNPNKRTLHSLNTLFEGSTITQANPANFSFELYLVDEAVKHQHKPLDFLLDYNGNTYNTFNLYFVYADYSPEVYYKIEKCVFTSGVFNIPRIGLMTVSLSGEGSKLTRTEGAFQGTDGNFNISVDYAISKDFKVTVGSQVLQNILGASLEVQNEINWTPNNTIQSSLAVTDASNTTYPASFSLKNRNVGGSIRQYVTDIDSASTSNLQTWQQDVSVRIQAGLNRFVSPPDYQLDVNMQNACSFTNRASFGEVFTQNYDYRLTKSADLNTYFTY